MTTPVGQAPRVVLGRYAMGPAIGRGATAVVHRARDLETGEQVAVKAVPAELGIADRVDVEARAAARLAHPGVVALRDAGRDDECLYLVCDLVEGTTLAAELRAGHRPPDRAAVRMAAQVLDALAHAHGRGVLHRDVKPANILIDADGRALLSDFGVARIIDETSLTIAGSVVGTVAYMAPEQAAGRPVGPEADVYAACLVLYECLTGANPVKAPGPAETARRAVSGAIPPIARERPDLPAALLQTIDAGLDPHPARRPAASAAAEALAAVADGPVAAAPAPLRRALPPLACAAAGAALAVVAMSAGAPAAWSGDGATLLAAAAGGALAAWAPRLAAALAVIGGALLLGLHSPGLAIVLAPPALALLALGRPHGRLILLPVLAPALFAVGLGPLYAAAAGLAPRWPARLWTALAGMCAAVGWQVAAGADAFLAGGGYLDPAAADLDGEQSPAVAARRLWEPLSADPAVLSQVGVVVAAALCVPLVRRAPAGPARVVAAGAWTAALAAGLAATAGDLPAAIGATIPAAVIVLVWAIWPWPLRGAMSARRSATLRSSPP